MARQVKHLLYKFEDLRLNISNSHNVEYCNMYIYDSSVPTVKWEEGLENSW